MRSFPIPDHNVQCFGQMLLKQRRRILEARDLSWTNQGKEVHEFYEKTCSDSTLTWSTGTRVRGTFTCNRVGWNVTLREIQVRNRSPVRTNARRSVQTRCLLLHHRLPSTISNRANQTFQRRSIRIFFLWALQPPTRG